MQNSCKDHEAIINCRVCHKPIEKGLYIHPGTKTAMHRGCLVDYKPGRGKTEGASLRGLKIGKNNE